MIMKKITFLVANILLLGNVANASVMKDTDGERNGRYSFEEPISFIERGIEFFVFPNGDFDFNTRPQDSQGDYYYRTAGRREAKTAARRPVNYGVLIEHDSFGRVRRIGNTFINYDSRDRVNRIGSVYMKYNRHALTQIGGMRIVYNNRGDIVNMIGRIKGWGSYGYAYNYDNDDNRDYTSSNNGGTYYYRGAAKTEDNDK